MSTTAAENTREQLLANVKSRLREVADADLEAVESPSALGGAMVSLVPRTAGAYGKLIGPVYSTKALEAMWGISRAAISKQVGTGKLLALKVKDRHLFPVFQFKDKQVRPDVLGVVRQLRDAVDPFTIAQWMRAPLDDHDGRTPLEMLDTGDEAVVLSAARQAAFRWTM